MDYHRCFCQDWEDCDELKHAQAPTVEQFGAYLPMRLCETVASADSVADLIKRGASPPGSRAEQTKPPQRSTSAGGTPMHFFPTTFTPRDTRWEKSPRDQIIAEHLPLVLSIAWAMHKRLPSHVLIEDLYSAGLVGLVDAAAKFSDGQGAAFSSYAHVRIRGAIIDSLREADSGTRRIRRMARDMQKTIAALTTALGREPSDDETAKALGTDLRALHRTRCEVRALEMDWESSTKVAALPSRREDDPLCQYLGAELRARLTDAIASLKEHERTILTLYYYGEVKRKEIAAVYGVSESRISQVLGRAIARLRTQLIGLSPKR